MLGSPTTNQPYRVAIAGTITNAATGDIVPQAVVRITAAPVAFVEGVMAFLVAAIAHHPQVQAYSGDLIENWQRSLAPLATAQRLLDCLELPLVARPDQTETGGDGHYCFFDLPPGLYQLTATYTLPHRGRGVTSAQVEVVQSDRRLSFAAVDLAISLVPGACPLTVVGDRSPSRPLEGSEQYWHSPTIAHPRAETLSH